MEEIKNFLSVVIAAGAFQGLFIGVILFTLKRGSTGANRLLALLMLVFSLSIAHYLLYEKYFSSITSNIKVNDPFQFLIGPLFYLYVKELTGFRQGFKLKELLHFLPFIISIALIFPFYRHASAGSETFVRVLNTLLWLIFVIYTCCYLTLVHYLIKSHQKRIRNNFSNIDKINLSWIKFFSASLALCYLLYLLLTPILIHASDPYLHFNKIVTLTLACLIYGIGYRGLTQPRIFSGSEEAGNGAGEERSSGGEQEESTVQALPEVAAAAEEHSPEEGKGGKYLKSSLDEAEIERGIVRLKEVIEEKKLYKSAELTLADLAGELGSSTHNLSQIINFSTGQNFYDFINSYRVEEVKKYLADPEKVKKYTILSLAFDAGFNSKATFNKVFKRMTGLTPSAYISSLK